MDEVITIPQLIGMLNTEMEAHQNPDIARSMSAYLKDRFQCYGIKSPVRNDIQKVWFKKVKSASINQWDLVYNLWALDQREYQYIAVDYMNKIPKRDIKLEDSSFLEELICTKSWWETVDSIASNYVSFYFQKFPDQIDPMITKWRKSDNLWLNY